MRTMQDDVKEFLWRSRLSQKAFARIVGVNPTALSEFLHRSSGHSIAERIAPFIYGDKVRELIAIADAIRGKEVE